MTTSMISGLAGQDGTYLAELLLERGHRVVGAVHDIEGTRVRLPHPLASRVELVEWDLRDIRRMEFILESYAPAAFYNLAALSSGSAMFDDPTRIGEINGLAVSRTLEAIDRVAPGTRFLQASSSEMFGNAERSPQSEQTPFRPRSPYGAAKLFAHTVVGNYRDRKGMFACSAILYNHESPRRRAEFVTRKVSMGAASIKLGLRTHLRVGNLDARRDWGYAPDFVRAMWLMLEHTSPGDYVIATGQSRSVRDLCEAAFSAVGLDYRAFVSEDPVDARPVEPFQLVGDSTQARSVLGWIPEVGFPDWVGLMVESDLRQLEAQVKKGNGVHVQQD